LLLEAHRQLALGEPKEALVLLSEHARRFPTSSMRQEREAATIVASCNQGAFDNARQQWQAFVKQWPNSPFVERIRGACHWSAEP
jgi:outer membrane protein assembly factor BamD (BamD/ComL family)